MARQFHPPTHSESLYRLSPYLSLLRSVLATHLAVSWREVIFLIIALFFVCTYTVSLLQRHLNCFKCLFEIVQERSSWHGVPTMYLCISCSGGRRSKRERERKRERESTSERSDFSCMIQFHVCMCRQTFNSNAAPVSVDIGWRVSRRIDLVSSTISPAK